MIYEIVFAPQAKEDLIRLKRSEPIAYAKAMGLIYELQEHPRTGTGKPKPLAGNRSGQWSRRISLRHRLVYSISDITVRVFVISSYGHYEE